MLNNESDVMIILNGYFQRRDKEVVLAYLGHKIYLIVRGLRKLRKSYDTHWYDVSRQHSALHKQRPFPFHLLSNFHSKPDSHL